MSNPYSSFTRPRKPPKRGDIGHGAARLRRTRKLVKEGRRTKAWAKVRRELKKEFAAAGVTRCEVCGVDDNLGFAHTLKRRHITTDGQMREVALLCNSDHDKLELLGEAKMRPAIEALIAKREAA